MLEMPKSVLAALVLLIVWILAWPVAISLINHLAPADERLAYVSQFVILGTKWTPPTLLLCLAILFYWLGFSGHATK